VDQDGNVLDILVTSRRDAKAATRFFRKLLKGLEYVCHGGGVVRLAGWVFGRSVRGWTILGRGRHAIVVVV
jgi:hypothetical protein